MRRICSLLLLFVLCEPAAFAQREPISHKLFFLDDRVVEVNLSTDIKKLRSSKGKPTWQPANIEMKFSDTLVVKEPVSVQVRGVFRKSYCDLASLVLNFKSPASPRLSKLKKMKLVGGCRGTDFDEELLLKEYLVYKLYSQLTPMSFRVRLLHVTYSDSRQKMKTYTQYAFLIEDVEDVAERNNCKEEKFRVYNTERTNRLQISFVCIFQYMIGNTDFSVPNRHNVKLMVPKTDSVGPPYTIPYDFDFAGIVNAPYALPREELGILSVRVRLYRGFPRTMEELRPMIEVFKEKKETLLLMIKNFDLFSDKSKDDMTNYLKKSFEDIENERMVKQQFITRARTE